MSRRSNMEIPESINYLLKAKNARKKHIIDFRTINFKIQLHKYIIKIALLIHHDTTQ
jgi:hypothetical protein